MLISMLMLLLALLLLFFAFLLAGCLDGVSSAFRLVLAALPDDVLFDFALVLGLDWSTPSDTSPLISL